MDSKMDNLLRKQPKAAGLIRILFGVICFTVLTMLILIFVLRVNEIVKAPKGEIIAENVPIEYIAPFESDMDDIRITEGMSVAKGDTLMVLYNPTILNNFNQLREDIQLEEENIKIYEKLLATLESKLNFQKRKEGDIKSEMVYSEKSTFLEINSLQKRLTNLQTKLTISRNRLNQDFKLLSEGVISTNEYATKKKAYLVELDEYTDLQKQLNQKKEEKDNIGDVTTNKMNSQKLNFLSVEHEFYNTQKILHEKRMRFQSLKRKYEVEEKEMLKRYIISDIDGHVSWLFNTRQDKSFVPKGNALVKITPSEKERFYARLSVPERAIKDVKVGQATHLKLNAYNHYQYGVIKGTVSYVQRDTSNYFFVLADITDEQINDIELRDGFQFKGEVIIGEIPLYQFILKRLFTKLS